MLSKFLLLIVCASDLWQVGEQQVQDTDPVIWAKCTVARVWRGSGR